MRGYENNAGWSKSDSLTPRVHYVEGNGSICICWLLKVDHEAWDKAGEPLREDEERNAPCLCSTLIPTLSTFTGIKQWLLDHW